MIFNAIFPGEFETSEIEPKKNEQKISLKTYAFGSHTPFHASYDLLFD